MNKVVDFYLEFQVCASATSSCVSSPTQQSSLQDASKPDRPSTCTLLGFLAAILTDWSTMHHTRGTFAFIIKRVRYQ